MFLAQPCGGARHQFKGVEFASQGRLPVAIEGHGVSSACQPQKGRHTGLRLRIQLHGGSGNDTQRALRANKQLLDVVSGVVLLQGF